MKLLGWTITRNQALQPVDNRGGWFSLIRESFAGAWQRDITVRVENALIYTAVFWHCAEPSTITDGRRIRSPSTQASGAAKATG